MISGSVHDHYQVRFEQHGLASLRMVARGTRQVVLMRMRSLREHVHSLTAAATSLAVFCHSSQWGRVGRHCVQLGNRQQDGGGLVLMHAGVKAC